MSNLIDIDGRLIDADHARIAFQIMEGGACNITALAGHEIGRMLTGMGGAVGSEIAATRILFDAVAEAGRTNDYDNRRRLVGLLMDSANGEHVLAGLDYPPVYIILDQIRNVARLSCNSPLYWDRWAAMWTAVREAAGQ